MLTAERIKELRALCEAWDNNEIDYLDYAQQCGDALPSLLDEVEKLKRVIAEAHNIATGKAVGEFNDGDDVVAAIRTKLSEAV